MTSSNGSYNGMPSNTFAVTGVKRIHDLMVINKIFLGCLCGIGVILLILTSWMLSNNLWHCYVINFNYIAAWLTLAVGLFLIILSVSGFVLVARGKLQSTFMPLTACVVVTCLCLFVSLVLSAYMDAEMYIEGSSYDNGMKSFFVEVKTYFTSLPSPSTSGDAYKWWNNIQMKFSCCGAASYLDWLNETSQLPSMTTTSATSTFDKVPDTCLCSTKLADSDCVQVNVEGQTLPVRLIERGCRTLIQSSVSSHMVALKALCPLAAIFIVIALLITIYFSLHTNRMAAVDVLYAVSGETTHEEAPNNERQLDDLFSRG